MMHAIVDHIWQSTLFALVAGSLVCALRRNGAHVRYWIWFAASAKFLVPFSLLFALGAHFDGGHSFLPPAATTVTTTLQRIAAAPLPTRESDSSTTENTSELADLSELYSAVLLVWVLGCVALLLRWLSTYRDARAIARAAQPIALPAPIPVRIYDADGEPGVFGIIRPVLLLPRCIVESLTPVQLQALLEHEMCHVRRRDNLTAAVHTLVQALFWFHPLVWWLGARLVKEREFACDEAALRSGHAKGVYAETILAVCRSRAQSMLAIVAGAAGADLVERIEFIMRGRPGNELSVGKQLLLGLTGSTAILAPICIGLTAPSAARAQTPAADRAIGPELPQRTDVARLRRSLDELEERFTDRHPTVRCLQAELDRLASQNGTGAPAVDGVALIQPGDSVRIFVWNTPQLCATVRVRNDGRLSSPLIKDMPAGGKTSAQLARDIETALSEFLRLPQVVVSVTAQAAEIG